MQISDEALKEQVKALIVTCARLKVPASQLKDDQPLFDAEKGLGLDSIDVLEIVVNVEKSYGVQIPDKETGRLVLSSVNSLVDYLRKNGASPRP
jgi:acyl carrier protein